jgi:hypothetical protein
MRFATIAGISLCLLPLCQMVGCAEQAEGTSDPSLSSGASGGSGGSSATTGGSSGKGGGTSSSGGSSTSGGSAGSTTSSGGDAGAPDGAAGEAGGGSEPACSEHEDCDDENECTDDACNLGACQFTNNTDDCTDDGDDCTDDVCATGECTHPDNETCECEIDDDCDDDEPCTDDSCDGDHLCQYANNTGDCDPGDVDDEECTDDVCGGGVCTHPDKEGSCTDDGSTCTDDVCAEGACTHSDNDSCECITAADCDDMDACTFNRCSGSNECENPVHDGCGTGTAFVINSFDSAADWNAEPKVTTPDDRPMVATGITSNLEGDSNLYWADDDGASLIMDVASMTGLTSMTIEILATTTGTSGMMSVGVYNGSTWSDLPLSTFGTIGTSYAVMTVPLIDFGVVLSTITKVRLVSSPVGGLKIWRIKHIGTVD